ncbi:MAG: hypothetical protein A4E27_00840 [Methanobacterium sp. PtaU1.Bin242]|nr:MAG: hypothetical protein A4E27_00840 [Methanobacterium sp. PtaU1.Bin242]
MRWYSGGVGYYGIYRSFFNLPGVRTSSNHNRTDFFYTSQVIYGFKCSAESGGVTGNYSYVICSQGVFEVGEGVEGLTYLVVFFTALKYSFDSLFLVDVVHVLRTDSFRSAVHHDIQLVVKIVDGP